MTVSHSGQERLRWRASERVKRHPVWLVRSTNKKKNKRKETEGEKNKLKKWPSNANDMRALDKEASS